MLINWLPAALLSFHLKSCRNTARTRSHRRKGLAVEPIEARLLLIGPTPIWTPEGPGPIVNGGGNLGIPGNPSVGAIQSIAVDPTNPNVVAVASVNGGVWSTTDALDANPVWTELNGHMPSLAISALAIDPTNPAFMVAATGNYSASGESGPDGTIVKIHNNSESQLDDLQSLRGVNVSAVQVRGMDIGNMNGIVLVASAEPPVGAPAAASTGMYRSNYGGDNFQLISGNGVSGLPRGDVFDLVGDPNSSSVMYCAVGNAATGSGIYKSTDTGATWRKISNAAQDAELASATGKQENAKLAVGPGGVVDIIIDDTSAGASSDFIYQFNGTTWTTLDTPMTDENGTLEGLHPGGQGMLYLSIAADPTNANIIYVGGDRQPGPGDGNATFPNSIGATDYTGRIFRINASLPAGSQATALTNDASTNNNDAPHAGSRFMVVDSTGRLLEADDGGIYVRSNPTGTGDWSSLNSNLQIPEIISVGYDSITHQIVGGTVNNGNVVQPGLGSTAWNSIQGGSGGFVGVDDQSLSNSGESRVYTSTSYLQNFTETDFNHDGTIASVTANVGLIDTATGKSLAGGAADPNIGQYQPFVMNSVDPTHALIYTNNLWESTDSFRTVTNGYTSAGTITAALYGGVHAGVANSGVFIVGDNQGNIAVRPSQSSGIDTFTVPGGVGVKAIAANPKDWTQAFILDANGTIWSFNYNIATHAGTFTSLKALPALNNWGSGGFKNYLTLTAVPTGSTFTLVVGGYGGLMSVDPTSGTLGNLNFMDNPVIDSVTYNQADDVLVAGSLGRGVWTMSNASMYLDPTNPAILLHGNDVTFTTPPGTPVVLAPSAGIEPNSNTVTISSLTVTIASNFEPGDTLGIQNSGQISTSGNGIYYGASLFGHFTFMNGGSELQITFANNASLTAEVTLLNQITFANNLTPTSALRTVQFQVTNSLGNQNTPAQLTVYVVNNGTPVLTLDPGPVTLNAPVSPPVLVAPSGTLTDVGTPSFQGGQLSVSISANASSRDQLSVLTTSSISLNGNSVLYNGSVIGQASGGASGAPLTVSLTTSDATTAAVQALVQAIGFNDSVDPPSTAQRTLTFQVSDSKGSGSNTANVLVNVAAVDVPPVVTLNAASSTYTASNPPLTLAPDATVAYNDDTNFAGGSLTVSLPVNGMTTDLLTVQSLGGITVSGASVLYNGNAFGTIAGGTGGNPLVISFSNTNATIAATQALIQAIGFSTSTITPSTLPRTVQFVIDDGHGQTSAPVTMTANVIAQLPPIVVLQSSVNYTTGSVAVTVSPAATVSDSDSPNLNGGSLTVSITQGAKVHDRLTIGSQDIGPGTVQVSGHNVYYSGTLVGTLNAGGGIGKAPLVVTFNQQSTPAAAQAILSAVQFSTLGGGSGGARTLQAVVADNTQLASTPALEQINVSLPAKPVSMTLSNSSMTYQRGSGPVFVDAGATLADINTATFDGARLTFDVRGGTRNQLTIGTTADIQLNNRSVLFDGQTIGRLVGDTVHFNADATTAAVQALIRAITFSTSGAAGHRTATLVFVDGQGGTARASKTIVV